MIQKEKERRKTMNSRLLESVNRVLGSRWTRISDGLRIEQREGVSPSATRSFQNIENPIQNSTKCILKQGMEIFLI